MEIIPWNPLQHPLLSATVTPSQQNRWHWIFGRSFYTFWTNTNLILRQIQRWIWEKKLIKLKSRGFNMITCYTQVHSILHFFITFPWSPPRTRTNNLSHTSFSSSFSFLYIHTMPSPLVSLHDLPWACSPCPMKAWNPFAPINGLLILQGPMRMNGHPIEIRMRILGPNGTQKIFHPPIKEDNNPHD